MEIEPSAPAVCRVSRVVVFVAFAAMAFASLGIFFWRVVIPSVVSGVPLRTWSWGTIALFAVGLLMMVAWLGIGVFRRFSTVLSPEGVTWPTLSGSAWLSWSQIERVSVKGHEIWLYGADKSAVVNVFCFSEPQAVQPYIFRNVPPAAQPRSAG